MNERVPDHQGLALVFLFVLGNSTIFGLGKRAGADIWLAYLLAIAIALPFILMQMRWRMLMPGRNLWEGLGNLIGKWPARFVVLYYSFYAWRLASLVVTDLTRFIAAVSLENTPTSLMGLMLALLALWGVKAGVEALGRWSIVTVRFIIPLSLLMFLLILTEVNLRHFLPVLYHGFLPVVMGALELLDFPFLTTGLVFWVFDSFEEKESPKRIFLPGFLIAAVMLLFISSSVLAVIGAHKYSASYFPTFVAISRIDIARFLSRLETSVGILFVVGSFLKLSVCLLVASKGLAWGLGFTDYRFLVTPLALGTVAGSQWFTKDLMEIYFTATKMLHPYDLSIQLVIPLILWVVAEVKHRGQR
ncbi:MAG: endospore germination permease [Limnochordia bacterium]